MHFISVYSLLWVCVYVCVCRAGPVCVKWNGGGCLFSVTVRRVEGGRGRGRGRGRDRQTWLAEIVFTLWPESDGNRTALPNRVLQIHRYTESVLRQNTADPSHIYNSFRPGETSVSARRTQDLLSVCCSICVSLSPQKRRHSTWERERERERDLLCVCFSICVSLSPQKRRHPVCPELMFPAHVDYIMTYYPFILLKCIFYTYMYKSYTVPYLILFLSHTYNSHSFCTTYLIRFKY